MTVHELVDLAEAAGGTIARADIEATMDALAAGRSVVVAGTVSAGRIEFARALANIAGVPVVSAVYSDQADVGQTQAAVIELGYLGDHPVQQWTDRVVPTSTYNTHDTGPAEPHLVLSVDRNAWALHPVTPATS